MAKSLVSCFFDSRCICAPVLELRLRSCKTQDKEYRFRFINFIFTVKARQSENGLVVSSALQAQLYLNEDSYKTFMEVEM